MHADEAALLRAVCEAPDDDAPRLIYADWLDDSGDEAGVARAEFVRLQIRLESVGVGSSSRRVFKQRAWQLLHDHNPTWLGTMGMSLWGVRYRRGFLERATTRSDLILANHEWFATQPITELDCQLDARCWQLVLDHLRRLGEPETADGLVAAWHRACAADPRPTLAAAGGEAEALAAHPLVRRARRCGMSVSPALFSSQFTRHLWVPFPRG